MIAADPAQYDDALVAAVKEFQVRHGLVADGTIGGLVFAETRTNAEVGYALSPTSIAVRIAPGMGRTGAAVAADARRRRGDRACSTTC